MHEIFYSPFMINTDSYYISAQKPQKNCQDYCLDGEIDGMNYGILADGCSMSKYSEIGSKILCHAAKSLLNEMSEKINDPDNTITNLTYSDISEFKSKIIKISNEVIRPLNIDIGCLDSTLLISFISNDLIHTFMFGDGCFAISNLNNELKLFKSISYDGNAPYYLSYLLNDERNAEYKKSFKSKTINIESEFSSYKEIEESTQNSYNINFLLDSKCFLMCSDGVESFYNFNTMEKVPSIDVIKKLLDIKTTKGEFIKRASKRMIQDFSKDGIYNTDDLSIVGFMINKK